MLLGHSDGKLRFNTTVTVTNCFESSYVFCFVFPFRSSPYTCVVGLSLFLGFVFRFSYPDLLVFCILNVSKSAAPVEKTGTEISKM